MVILSLTLSPHYQRVAILIAMDSLALMPVRVACKVDHTHGPNQVRDSDLVVFR